MEWRIRYKKERNNREILEEKRKRKERKGKAKGEKMNKGGKETWEISWEGEEGSEKREGKQTGQR